MHVFNWGSTMSHGALAGDIPGLEIGARRLATGIVRDLFVEDADRHWERVQVHNEDELKPTRYFVPLESANNQSFVSCRICSRWSRRLPSPPPPISARSDLPSGGTARAIPSAACCRARSRFAHRGRLERGFHRGVHLVDDLGVEALRAEEAEPGVALVAGQAGLGDGRDLAAPRCTRCLVVTPSRRTLPAFQCGITVCTWFMMQQVSPAITDWIASGPPL